MGQANKPVAEINCICGGNPPHPFASNRQ
jgi:hypothetical protein